MQRDEPEVLQWVENTYTYTRRRRRGTPLTSLEPETDNEVASELPMEWRPEVAPVAQSAEKQPREESKGKGRDGNEEGGLVDLAPQASRSCPGRPRRFRSSESGKEPVVEPPLEQQLEDTPAGESMKQRKVEAVKAKRRDEEEWGRQLEMPPLTRCSRKEEALRVAKFVKKQKRQEAKPAVAEPFRKQRQEEDDVAEDGAAVPIGKPMMVTGKQGKRKHYASFEYNDHIYKLVIN